MAVDSSQKLMRPTFSFFRRLIASFLAMTVLISNRFGEQFDACFAGTLRRHIVIATFNTPSRWLANNS